MTVSEAAERVIDLAGRVRAYYEVEVRKRHKNYPLVMPGEEEPPPPPEQEELRAFLESLPDAVLYRLLALMYLGREDFPAEDFAENAAALRKAYKKREYAVSEMIDTAPLADILSDGLEALRRHGIDPEVTPKKVKLRKS